MYGFLDNHGGGIDLPYEQFISIIDQQTSLIIYV